MKETGIWLHAELCTFAESENGSIRYLLNPWVFIKSNKIRLVKVISVVGARPQFVKLAPIDHAFQTSGIEHIIIHTGQHYDPEMSDSFFSELDISPADFNLGVGSGSHADQTARMMVGLEKLFLQIQPDWVLVFGDTNSTLAAAIAAVKVHIKLAHLEAGLRSFNRKMPEEHNRILTDHVSDLLLAPSVLSMKHLAAEGLAERSILVGDVMTDVCLNTLMKVSSTPSIFPEEFEAVGLSHKTLTKDSYFIATIHRAENTDDSARLKEVVLALQKLPLPVVLMTHPRLAARCNELGIELNFGSVKSVKSVSYPVMIDLISNARGVITDSGGLQKEAYIVGTPCTTIRTETEWPETTHDLWNVLSADVDELGTIVMRARPILATGSPYGDGKAAYSVVSALKNFA